MRLFANLISAGRVCAKGAKSPKAGKGTKRRRGAVGAVTVCVQVDCHEMARLSALSLVSARPLFVDLSRVSGTMPNRAWFVKDYRGSSVPIYRYAKNISPGSKYWVYHFKRLDNGEWLTRSHAKQIKKLVETHVDKLIETGELRKNPEIDSAFVAFEQFAENIPGRRGIHAVIEELSAL